MDGKNCGIYKITSPTGKIYIGQSINLKRRFFKTYRNLRCKGQVRLYNSFKKHGVENHQFDIIEYCSEDDLNCSERFWQDEFDVIGKMGLNCILQSCGEKRRTISQETKRKMSEAMLGEKHHYYGKSFTQEHKRRLAESNMGRVVSEETRKKLSESLKGKIYTEETKQKIRLSLLGEKSPWYGKTHTEETKQKMSNSQVGGKNHQAKLVLNLDTGIFYDTATEAAVACGMNKSTFRDQISGKRKNKTLNYIYV